MHGWKVGEHGWGSSNYWPPEAKLQTHETLAGLRALALDALAARDNCSEAAEPIFDYLGRARQFLEGREVWLGFASPALRAICEIAQGIAFGGLLAAAKEAAKAITDGCSSVGIGRPEKVRARQQDILRALPASEKAAMKSQTDLKDRLARSYTYEWGRDTIRRDLKDLRAEGLVYELHLRRTPEGDRRVRSVSSAAQ
jgi:hypothetical protein